MKNDENIGKDFLPLGSCLKKSQAKTDSSPFGLSASPGFG